MPSPFCASVLLDHNKGGPIDINIAQILHLSNFFELKRNLVCLYSFTIVNQKSVRYSVCLILQIYSNSGCKQRTCLHYGLDMVFEDKDGSIQFVIHKKCERKT